VELAAKPDADKARQRVEAWWAGRIIDRVCIKVTAPLAPSIPEPEPDDMSPEDIQAYWFDSNVVIPRWRRSLARTWWGGEAFPVIFPMSIFIPAVTAAYLGCPLKVQGTHTGWCESIITDWDRSPELTFDPDNQWYQRTVELLRAAGSTAPGEYYLGLPDLNGPGELLSRLRGPENLALDLIENPQRVHDAMKKINRAWFDCWKALTDVIREYVDGYFTWMRLWSEAPAIDLQTDFSIMISQNMFDTFFLPHIEQQTEWVGRTIYHLDGPGAARHLDSLLELPKLTGIQWVPGAGAPSMSHWIDLLKRVQSAGKLLYITCRNDEVEVLLSELRPEGLLINTYADSVRHGQEIIKLAERMTAAR